MRDRILHALHTHVVLAVHLFAFTYLEGDMKYQEINIFTHHGKALYERDNYDKGYEKDIEHPAERFFCIAYINTIAVRRQIFISMHIYIYKNETLLC